MRVLITIASLMSAPPVAAPAPATVVVDTLGLTVTRPVGWKPSSAAANLPGFVRTFADAKVEQSPVDAGTRQVEATGTGAKVAATIAGLKLRP